MVLDSDTLTETKDRATARAVEMVKAGGVPIVGDERPAIMHHKFAVLDGERVWTGSWNWTDGDTYRLNNNAAEIRSPALAADYAAEFEKLLARSRSGAAKPPGVPYPRVDVGGAALEVFFSPQDRPASTIAARVRAAQRSVHFLAFSFTHDAIGQAMLDRARAGVEVSGVFETTGSETRFSEYGRLKQAGLAVYQDGNPFIMHHKVIVLDGRLTIFGSFNFSDAADRDNDENVLIVDDPAFAQAFEAEFQRVLAAAKAAPR
jgi:phosphatidylserine/phosphatidylglycerophosphate/cardiolipin synthase-like enzyme